MLVERLTGDIGDGWVFRLASNLIDFIDVNDASLGPLDVTICSLQEVHDHVLDILTHVACLGKTCRVCDAERNANDAGYRLRQESLAAARCQLKSKILLFCSSTSSIAKLESMRL